MLIQNHERHKPFESHLPRPGSPRIAIICRSTSRTCCRCRKGTADCGRRKAWRQAEPDLAVPARPTFSALALPLLLFGLSAFEGFLLLEHLGVPQRLPCGELLQGERHAVGLAPDFDLHRCHSHRISVKNARGALVDRIDRLPIVVAETRSLKKR
jgi:hypothetical protein